jgi:hydroxymethylpyrimidine pyrophosphatase-like HAD family hydrolase
MYLLSYHIPFQYEVWLKSVNVEVGTTMYYLPWWMQWAQAVALFVISCLGSWIAYKQARIASAKLNLDLYEKRFRVFEAARAFALHAITHHEIEQEALAAFGAGTVDAAFLFEDELGKYLAEFGRKVFGLRILSLRLNSATVQEERDKLHNERVDYMLSVSSELDVLVERFKPYLKLGNI